MIKTRKKVKANLAEPIREGIRSLVEIIIEDQKMRDLQEWGIDNGVEMDNEGNINLDSLDIPQLQEIYHDLEIMAFGETTEDDEDLYGEVKSSIRRKVKAQKRQEITMIDGRKGALGSEDEDGFIYRADISVRKKDNQTIKIFVDEDWLFEASTAADPMDIAKEIAWWNLDLNRYPQYGGTEEKYNKAMEKYIPKYKRAVEQALRAEVDTNIKAMKDEIDEILEDDGFILGVDYTWKEDNNWIRMKSEEAAERAESLVPRRYSPKKVGKCVILFEREWDEPNESKSIKANTQKKKYKVTFKRTGDGYGYQTKKDSRTVMATSEEEAIQKVKERVEKLFAYSTNFVATEITDISVNANSGGESNISEVETAFQEYIDYQLEFVPYDDVCVLYLHDAMESGWYEIADYVAKVTKQSPNRVADVLRILNRGYDNLNYEISSLEKTAMQNVYKAWDSVLEKNRRNFQTFKENTGHDVEVDNYST